MRKTPSSLQAPCPHYRILSPTVACSYAVRVLALQHVGFTLHGDPVDEPNTAFLSRTRSFTSCALAPTSPRRLGHLASVFGLACGVFHLVCTFLHVVPVCPSLSFLCFFSSQLLKLAWPPVAAVLALPHPVRLAATHRTSPTCSCLSLFGCYNITYKISNLVGSLLHIPQGKPCSPTIRHVQRLHTTA